MGSSVAGIVDPSCEMPDYNALVRIEPVPRSEMRR